MGVDAAELAAATAPVRDHPDGTLVAVDFDGTLAPIVDVPSAARPDPEALDALVALASAGVDVLVISGRPVSFLDPLVPRPVGVVGLYGLERRGPDGVTTDPDGARWAEVVATVADAARRELDARVGVEDKGLSLTLHTRTAPELADAVTAWAEQAGARHDLLVRPARASVELHPPVATDKGTVLAAAALGRSVVLFAGDDVGDLAAFDALDDLALTGAVTLRVAVGSSEADPALTDRADLVVGGPTEVAALLRACLPA